MASTSSGFLHMVYFWGKENAGSDDARLLAEGARRHLTDIPGVLRLEVGFPFASERDVVDSSYLVALLVEFADAEGEAVYQVHPQHLAFIEENKQYWSKVRVYDSLVSRP